jgi:hypothetical protein
MLAHKVSWPVPRNDLQHELGQLAALDVGEAGFISCYLDLRDGIAASERFVGRRADELRATLPGGARDDFERALGMLRLQLRRTTEAGSPGLAVFARSLAGGSFLSSLRFGRPLGNHLTFYRIPDVVPLLPALDDEPGFTLVVVRNGALQVTDWDGSRATPRVWAAFASAGMAGQDPLGRVVIPERRLQIVRRVLAAANSTPLIIAGDAPQLNAVVDFLPRRAAGRLSGVIDVPLSVQQQEVPPFVAQRLADDRRASSQRLVDRLVRALRGGGRAVAGELAVHEALRAGAADTLIIAPEGSAVGWTCADCDAVEGCALPPSRCTHCGSQAVAEWHPVTEAVRLACHQGVRVVFDHSDRLRYLGGIACLLRQPADLQVMPEPTVPRPLDLVA